MAYTKQNFEDGQVLTAEHLNNMEQGIVNATLTFDNTPTENSTNPVTSGGLYTKFNEIESSVDEYFGAVGTGLYASQAGALTWDGVIGDKAYVELGENMYFVHISDEVPTVFAEVPLAQVCFSVVDGMPVTYGMGGEVSASDENGAYCFGEYVIITPADNYLLYELSFPKKGVYFFARSGVSDGLDASVQYVSSLRIIGYSFAESGADKYFEKVIETTTEVVGDTLTFDGNINNKTIVELNTPEDVSGITNYYMVKLSGDVPTVADFADGYTYTLACAGTVDAFTVDAETAQGCFEDDGYAFLDGVIIVPTDNYVSAGTEKGVYGIYWVEDGQTVYTSSISLPNYTFTSEDKIASKVIKTEHLPEVLRFGEQTAMPCGSAKIVDGALTWDGDTSGMKSVAGYAFCVVDGVPDGFPMDSTWTVTTSAGTSTEMKFSAISGLPSMYCGECDIDPDIDIEIDLEIFVTLKDNLSLEEFIFPVKGIYYGVNNNYHISSLYTDGYDFSDMSSIKLIEEKYLPNTVARTGCIPAIADVTEAPTAEQFNTLLAALRAAGLMKTE